MEQEVNFNYDVKCRKCNNITRMHFGTNMITTKEYFKVWLIEHSTYPIQKQCNCDNGMMLFHDIVGYGNILDVI